MFLLFLVLRLSPIYIVGPGEVGLVFNRITGKIGSYGQGLHMLLPIVEYVTKLDVRTQKVEVEAASYSKDIQNVSAKIALNFHIDGAQANNLFQEVGLDYENKIIQPAIQESVKATTAKFTAQELIEERPRVKDEIKTFLKERLQTWNVIVDEFSIANFDFSDAFENAVEQKQIAQQEALKAKNVLEAVKMQAEQRVTQAKAEAEAIKIQAQAITQQGGKDYVNLKAIEKWDGHLPQVTAGDKGMFLLNLEK